MAFKVAGLISLGLTLIFVGIVWMIYDGFLTNLILPKYWISNVYLDFMSVEFNVIPTLILLVGVLTTIIGAAGSK